MILNIFLASRTIDISIKKLFSILTISILLICFSFTSQATNITWTGISDTDWENPMNWSPIMVPTQIDDVTINDAPNAPIIRTAANVFVQSIYITMGGSLNIRENAVVNINGGNFDIFLGTGFYNEYGTVHNDGRIIIGETLGTGKYGIYNKGDFTNGVDGEIIIDWSEAFGAYHHSGIFTNRGSITIGTKSGILGVGFLSASTFNNHENASISVNYVSSLVVDEDFVFTNAGYFAIGTESGVYDRGLKNTGNFINTSTGQIDVYDISTDIIGDAIHNGPTYGSFTNEGLINISGAEQGIQTHRTFNNGGVINIENIRDVAVYCSHDDAALIYSNSGTINIGLNSVVVRGIENDESSHIINEASGQIHLNTDIEALESYGSFDNYGTVNSFTSNDAFILTGNNDGFINHIGGVFSGRGNISTNAFTGDGGLLKPGAPIGFFHFQSTSEYLSDNILEIEINGDASSGISFDQIVAEGSVFLSFGMKECVLNITTNYAPPNCERITILEAASLQGTFSAASSLGNWDIEYNSPNMGQVSLVYNPGGTNCNALAVELQNFDGQATDQANSLQWEVHHEQDIKYYQIERSVHPQKNWKAIGQVTAQNQSHQNYKFVDEQPLEWAYYRLNIAHTDGTFDTSEIISIKRDKETTLQVYPIPAQDFVTLEFNAPTMEETLLSIRDMKGQLIHQQKMTTSVGLNTVTFNSDAWTSGIYLLYMDNKTTHDFIKIVK